MQHTNKKTTQNQNIFHQYLCVWVLKCYMVTNLAVFAVPSLFLRPVWTNPNAENSHSTPAEDAVAQCNCWTSSMVAAFKSLFKAFHQTMDLTFFTDSVVNKCFKWKCLCFIIYYMSHCIWI